MRHVPSPPPPTHPLVHFPTAVCLQNELGILEFIHALVETLDKYFENVVRNVARGPLLRSDRSPHPPPTLHPCRGCLSRMSIPVTVELAQ